jgi:haloalkane dehalogenase
MPASEKLRPLVDWRQLYPFASHWFDVPAGRMHYIDEAPAASGGSAMLLFVHGNPTWSFHWRRLIVALRSRYRCVAPDHLGCGLSHKPKHFLRLDQHIDNLVALVKSLDSDQVTLVAQDWGGAVGLGAMLHMRERLARIVLFNTGAFPPRYIPWRIRACRVPLLGRLAVQGANLFSRAAMRMTLARHRVLEPAVAAGYLAPYDSWSKRRAVYGFVRDIPVPRSRARGGGFDVESRTDTTRCDSTWLRLVEIERELPTLADRPALLVWGMRDWCFRPDCLDRFVEAWPHADVHRLPDVGHWVVEDAPDESLSRVESFLTKNQCREAAATAK